MRAHLVFAFVATSPALCAVASPPTYRVVFTDREPAPPVARIVERTRSLDAKLNGMRMGEIFFKVAFLKPNVTWTRWDPINGHVFLQPGEGVVGQDAGASASDINELGHMDGSWVLLGEEQFEVKRRAAGVWLNPTEFVEFSGLDGLPTWIALMNDKDSVAGADPDPALQHKQFPLLWERLETGGFRLHNLGDLGGSLPTDSLRNVARDVNNRGQVVGNAVAGNPDCDCAFLWSEETGMINLGDPMDSRQSSALAINDHGWAVGLSSGWAALWRGGPPGEVLGGTGGGIAIAEDINNRNQIVGEINGVGFLWQDETLHNMVDLIDPAFNVESVSRTARINDAGVISAFFKVDGEFRSGLLIPTPRDCPADIDEDGGVGASDLVAMLDTYGKLVGFPDAGPIGRLADLDNDGTIGPGDLLALLASWRSCSGAIQREAR